MVPADTVSTMRRMATDDLKERRLRYVRALLAWHGKGPGDLGPMLGITPAAGYHKLDGRRGFSPADLLAIAAAFDLDPGLLLRPPALDDVLGKGTGEPEDFRCYVSYQAAA